MNEVSIATVGSDDWQPIGHLSEPMTFTLDAHAGADMVEMLFGLDPRQIPKPKPEPTHAVWMTYTDEVSGEPEKPKHVPGFIAWLKGTNRKAQKQYMTDLFRWIGAGKPPKQVEVQLYVPKARITPS